MGVAMGSGRGAQVVAIGGLDLPGSSFLTGSSRHRRAWLMRCGPSPDPPDRRDSLLKEKKENEKKVGVFQF
ncbi:hypothetical protein CK203_079889 [Vitis vinifera]|uniref:Uncharacterized protein n=1 Tax=Vitis vinifera TaxID=29760 RepID=A0A438DI49_VITVI|nr:hypothetical protein CK203_079889 [Vitis vinifera]